MKPLSCSPFRRSTALLGLAAILTAPSSANARGGSPDPIAVSVSHADPARGRSVASAQCGICHSFTEGGPSLIGPDLYGVVGRPIASVRGYSYSAALSAKKGAWTDAALDAWLAAPAAWAPGTKMGYAGLTDPGRRADVIAYLNSLAPKIPSK